MVSGAVPVLVTVTAFGASGRNSGCGPNAAGSGTAEKPGTLGGSPVPVSRPVPCPPRVGISVMVPARSPIAPGTNLTETEQVSPWCSTTPTQVFAPERVKSPALLPPITIESTCNGPKPWYVTGTGAV